MGRETCSKPSFSAAIVGGDARQEYLAGLLCEKGFPIYTYGISPVSKHENLTICSSLEEAVIQNKPDWVIGPVPFCRGNQLVCSQPETEISVSALLSALSPAQKLAGGCLPNQVLAYCMEHHICCYDFMNSEPVAIFNTIATAEGAIAEAITQSALNLHHANVLILGYGRCGKTLADKLSGLSARVTVCDRSDSACAVANALGCDTLPWNHDGTELSGFSYIFNTIPFMVLNQQMLSHIQKNAVIIDIASAPGGVDYNAAKKAGIKAGLYPGLPGRYAPLSSAKILADDLAAQFASTLTE